ncbi:MAG: threonine ammonia-lyase [bacterium]
MNMPTLEEVKQASQRVYQHLQPTPLHYYPGLSELIGTQTWVKHENHLPVGAFKVRGGVNMAAQLNEAQKKAGLYTASTGNHGQSIAYAAQLFGAKAVIYVPENANQGKVRSMRNLGAEVVYHGADFDQARLEADRQCQQHNGLFVGPTDEELIKGVGSYTLEIMQDLPETDVIIVPVGAGSGACATAIVAKNINPNIKVIGVQSAQAPAMQKSWASGSMIEDKMETFAEGLATRVPFANTQKIMRHYLDDFILVDDNKIKQAIKIHLQETHNLIEEAGAASLAAALQIKGQLGGLKLVLIATGGNLSLEKLKDIL